MTRKNKSKIDSKKIFSRGGNTRVVKYTNNRESFVNFSSVKNSFGSLFRIGTFFSISLLLLIILSFGLIFSYNYITSCRYFSIKEIIISGNLRLDSREILETCRISNGGNLLAINLDETKGLLTKNPWVKEASVQRILPDTLSIKVEEKKPAFWIEDQSVLYYADINGNKIAPVSKEQFTSFPTLVIEPGAEVLKNKLPDIVHSLANASLPINMSEVSWIRLSLGNGVELALESIDLKISIYYDNWAENLNNLALALRDMAARGELKNIYDIRSQSNNVWATKK
ncbi:cell division protein FtsQ/DivIB [Desulfovibrio litoralis]|uniref:Cell division protein FtsQ n=1 Tax=Desulfovibrio litoralis DSM 11393 TaxID=1121455 RepID=A0A1M7SLS7_9BACT|nr:FtsQ-type POTRA domain-containing protein [Desulfovibrio litoralis]SHN59390.1 cell division protein FtsQ [Desulfovibrio litoralis DSM 11393]